MPRAEVDEAAIALKDIKLVWITLEDSCLNVVEIDSSKYTTQYSQQDLKNSNLAWRLDHINTESNPKESVIQLC